MPVAIMWLLGGTAAAVGGGYLIKSAGNAVEDTTNSTLKLAAAGVVAFVLAKHFKVI